MHSTYPPKLQPGDTIGLVAPSSPFLRERMDVGVNLLESLGFRTTYESGLFEKEDYLAGSDQHRCQQLQHLFADPQVRAIWAVRGGYGSMRLLTDLDYSLIRQTPKLLLGFSDITALHSALYTHAGLPGIHGPNIGSLPDASIELRNHLFALIAGETTDIDLFPQPLSCWNPGTAEGWLLPANLSILSALGGTPYRPDLNGAILLLEDVDESAYRVDRMLTQLELAGDLDRIAALAIGQFTTQLNDPEEHKRLVKKRILQLAKRHHLPVLGDCPFGHVNENYPIPVGLRARLDAEAERITLLDSPVR